MGNNEQMSSQELKIQAMIGRFLESRNAVPRNESVGPHLDEDSFSAFTEGRLSEREAKPMITHLVDCSFCRNVTAELVRMDIAFAETETIAPAAAAEPTRVSDVLSSLFSKIFGSSDGAVFAHHETEESEEEIDAGEKKENNS